MFQAKVVIAEATAQGKENTNCAWEGKCQQSRLESWVKKRDDNREFGGKD